MPIYVGDRIRQARSLRWRTSRELAAELRWPAPRLTRVERAEVVEVSEEDAQTLQRFLRFPAAFFETEADPPLTEQDLLFRAPKRTTRREKTYLAEFARLTSFLLRQLDSRHRLPAVKLPNHRGSAEATVKLAAATREALQVGRGSPIGHLTHQLERTGAVVVVRPSGLSPEDIERFDDAAGNRRSEVHYGYSTWIGDFRDRPLIVMRASASWERTRWTLAHELGHLLLHRHELPLTAEEEASRFAGELLAPAQEIAISLSQPVTLSTLIEVKMKWGISIGALLPHLWHSRLITRERFEALRTQLYTRKNPETGRTWGFDEPGWRKRKPERPRLLSAWSERCFGASDPNVLALHVPELPTDLLADMLREQRSGKGGEVESRMPQSGGAQVHKLDDIRRTRRRHSPGNGDRSRVPPAS